MRLAKDLLCLPFLFLMGCLNAQVESGTNVYGTHHVTNTAMGCGHFLDDPLYYFKKVENRSLDAMPTPSKTQKEEIGQRRHGQLQKEYVFAKDFDIKKTVYQVFAQLKEKAASRTDFKLHVIASEEINAFTTIGGNIYLTTGLLHYVTSKDELAFIIGHEMGHHEKLHLERKIKKVMTTATLFSKTGVDAFTKIALDVNSKVSAPFDQIDEYEADKYGFVLAQACGFDSRRFADFFKRLETSQQRSLLRKLVATHPFAADRKNCIESYSNTK